MIEGVTRARGLVTLASELGFTGLEGTIRLGTDSSAAKSFVCRRGLGRMKHLQIRDLWLQKEVAEGRLVVFKTPGADNPADLMTKILGAEVIKRRLEAMSIEMIGVAARLNEVNQRGQNIKGAHCAQEAVGTFHGARI